MNKFPMWLYHATLAARIVASQEELEALGDDWATHPDLVPAAAATVDAAETKPTRKRK